MYIIIKYARFICLVIIIIILLLLGVTEISAVDDNNSSFRNSSKNNNNKISPFTNWLMAIGSALGIGILSLLVVLLFPRRSRYKERIISLLLAFAVGTILSTVFYDLLPEVYGLHSHVSDDIPKAKTSYVLHTTVILGSIVVFFIFERQLMISVHKYHHHIAAGTQVHNNNNNNNNENGEINDNEEEGLLPSRNDTHTPLDGQTTQYRWPPHYDTHIHENHDADPSLLRWWWKSALIKPYAFINIVADSIHNYADGLSIGAAFSLNIVSGVAVTLAMMVHEIPEGLGDFVILMKSGMSKNQAIVCNLLSTIFRIVGVISGLTIAALSVNTIPWLLCISNGAFLYIALAHMMHELYHEGGRLHVLSQAFSMILGFSVLFVYIMWGENI